MAKSLPFQRGNQIITAGSTALAKTLTGKQKRFITILQEDFNFDIIQELVEAYGVVKRAKKLKPVEKHRLIQTYLLTILTFCVPKMKITEEAKETGDKIQFNINIGGPIAPTGKQKSSAQHNNRKGSTKSSVGGVNITIPTVKQADGSFAVDTDLVS